MISQISMVLAASDPSVTDWIEACATSIAAVGTIGAFVGQGVALRNERNTRRSEIARLETEQHQSQFIEARKVVAFNGAPAPSTIPTGDGSSGARKMMYQVAIGNYSQFPILNVIVQLRFHDEEANKTRRSKRAARFQVIPGGTNERAMWIVRDVFDNFKWPRGKSFEEGASLFDVETSWNDIHGARWLLGPGGQLRKGEG